MRLAVRSYGEAARRAGINLCRGQTPAGVIDLSVYDHDRGTIIGNTLHWADRRVRRPGLLRFCVLAARLEAGPAWVGLPHWQKTYFETITAYRIGLRIGIRFRRDEMTERKVRVRSRLLTTHIRPQDRALAEKVMDWARRDHT